MQLDDVSSGVTTFEFDALGRTFQRTDAKGQKTRYTYDVLDRMTQRIVDYQGTNPVINSWDYDTSANGIGLLASRSNPYVTETFTYDGLTRVTDRDFVLNVPGYPGNGGRNLPYEYLDNQRLNKVTYPDNLVFKRTFNPRGYDSQIQKANGSILEETLAMNAFGQVTQTQFVTGVKTVRGFDPQTAELTSIETGPTSSPRSIQDLYFQWNSHGTLHSRTDQRDAAADAVETFGYDALNRLKSATTTGAVLRTKSYQYDPRGNLEEKTSSVPGDLDAIWYNYGTHPYRLGGAQVAGSWNALYYDANGNVTRNNRTGDDDYFVDYDAANRAIRITVGAWASTPTPTARDDYWYGPDGERLVRKSTWQDAGTQKVSWVEYLDGGRYERVYPEHDASTQYVVKVMPSPNILHRFIRNSSGGGWQGVSFVHRDHLGSVDAITTWGGQIRSMAYDPFGSRRSSDWSGDATSSEMATAQDDLDQYTQHGFTDHEHLDRTGLIHMGGRIYDPRIGRFLQPDPVVTVPSFSQDQNRYAYAFNSPLNVIDPTGLHEHTGAGAACRAAAGCRTTGVYPASAPGSIIPLRILKITEADFALSEPWTATVLAGMPDVPVSDSASRPIFNTESFESGSTTVADAVGTAANAAGTAAIYFNTYVLGVEIREYSDLITAVPTAAIFLLVPELRAARGVAGSIRGVNPLRSATNCVNCAIATDATLAGRAASALPSGPTSISVLEKMFGGRFASVSGPGAIESQLLNAGSGARGIVFGSRGAGEVGHVFNAVNQNGVVRFLDGQIGGAASLEGYTSFSFLRTF